VAQTSKPLNRSSTYFTPAYCLRRIAGRMQCLDHVLPRARMELNSYRNLVSSCVECNSRKGEKAAKDFLRSL
jgi:5-methylcytosine-specific restriction endonuclease McrA